MDEWMDSSEAGWTKCMSIKEEKEKSTQYERK